MCSSDLVDLAEAVAVCLELLEAVEDIQEGVFLEHGQVIVITVVVVVTTVVVLGPGIVVLVVDATAPPAAADEERISAALEDVRVPLDAPVDELAALSRQKPGTLSYSALAIPMQITMENWKKKTGAAVVALPARGGGDIVTGLMTGTAPIAIVGLPNFLEHIRSGAVHAIAVDGDARSPQLPNIPTFAEIGYPNLAPVYFAFVAPAGTPSTLINEFYQKVREIGDDPAFRQRRLLDLGLVPVFDKPAEFAEYLKQQRENSRRLIAESGYEPR
mgnify:CR=1 FL=1